MVVKREDASSEATERGSAVRGDDAGFMCKKSIMFVCCGRSVCVCECARVSRLGVGFRDEDMEISNMNKRPAVGREKFEGSRQAATNIFGKGTEHGSLK